LFWSEAQFRERAKQINAYGRRFGSRGFRSGAMYREQRWFDALEFSYDMSVPNVAHLEPQRGGCCSLMPYFIKDIVELPLTTVQDYSLFHIIGDYSIDLWKRQAEVIVARHGLATFIAHPDYLIEKRARAVYVQLLAYLTELRERGVWLAAAGDVERWWRSRSAMNLVHDGHAWRIEGVGAERARLAYARIRNGELVYEMHPVTPPCAMEQCC
jgi:hypothetical protein